MPKVTRPTIVVFDLGGVLVDWDPRHLYRDLFDDPDEMESFLAEVTTTEWNAHQDAGRPWAEAVELLVGEHPERRELIEAFHRRWPEMLAGEIPGTVDVLAELRATEVRLVALSNWSAETFPLARERFDFLAWFEGIVISGDVGVNKPDRRIFEHLVAKFGIEPADVLFIDDSPANVEAASAFGFCATQFTDAIALRAELVRLGLLPDVRGGVNEVKVPRR
ncbi:MAG TPA: HAD family phosphatase [Gaiellaceae bacterium]|jgi:2-haloacid dehalogenase|nr:HAD family phosphatase [Gaiellaceae bacterium]